MDYSMGVDPDYFDECADWVRIVLNHPGVYRTLTGKQLHFDFDDQMGVVTLTGLKGNYIVGKLQCRGFKRPANATERNHGSPERVCGDDRLYDKSKPKCFSNLVSAKIEDFLIIPHSGHHKSIIHRFKIEVLLYCCINHSHPHPHHQGIYRENLYTVLMHLHVFLQPLICA